MRPRILAPVFLLFTFALTGCFRTHTNVYLNVDGSGLITETTLFSNTFLGLAESFQTDSTEEFSLYEEDDLLARADSLGEGVEFVSVEDVNEQGFQGYRAVYSFPDINRVHVKGDLESLNVGDEDDEMEDMDEAEPEDNGPGGLSMDVTFTYANRRLDMHIQRVEPEESQGDIHPDTLAAVAEEISSQMDEQMGLLAAFLSDARMTYDISFESNITETNASFVSDSTNTITLGDFRMGALLDLMKNEPELAAKMQLATSDDAQRAILMELGEREGIRFEPELNPYVILGD